MFRRLGTEGVGLIQAGRNFVSKIVDNFGFG